jgi:TolA-binding protein
MFQHYKSQQQLPG